MTEQKAADVQRTKRRQCEQIFGPGADMGVTSEGAFCRYRHNGR